MAWVALIPYLAWLLRRPPWTRVVLSHFLFASVYFGGVLYWIPRVLEVYGNLDSALAWLALGIMIVALGVFLLPFSLGVRWVSEYSPAGALWCAPGLWVLTELLRNYGALSGFPWAVLGYTQFGYRYLIQVSDLSGIYLVSALVVWANCALLARLRLGSSRSLILFFIACAVANGYGVYRVHFWQPVSGNPLRVALVQPNIELSRDLPYYEQKYFRSLPDTYRKALESGARWVIFPEAPNPYWFEQDLQFREFWRQTVRSGDGYLLLNSAAVQEPPLKGYFNSAYLMDASGETVYRYDKLRLVPFGEYIPSLGKLLFAEALVQEVSDFSPGKELIVGEVDGHSFGTLICYEAIFPELARGFVSQGAQILINITNDAWFGDTAAPRQHLQMAVVRAIESRKPLLRCANSGFTVSVTPWGEIEQQLELFEEGYATVEVNPNSERPVYSRIGESFNMLMVVTTVLAGLACWRKRQR